jgi:exodeoxyribonuclease VIII
MKDVMVDIETLGTGKNACVIQVGACYFDRLTGEIGETFKVNIDARSAVASGAEIDADTVYWWLSQSKEAITSVTADPKLDIIPAFTVLNNFLAGAKYIWSHATFDFVIITETLKRLKIKQSFRYTAARDIRTLTDLCGLKVSLAKREGVHHDGLDDARYQVAYCVEAFKALKQQPQD